MNNSPNFHQGGHPGEALRCVSPFVGLPLFSALSYRIGCMIGSAALLLPNVCASQVQPKPIEPIAQTQAAIDPAAIYVERIRAAIRPHIAFSPPVLGNPAVELKIMTASSGLIVGVEIVKPSDSPEWDKAAYDAVIKAERIPLDFHGRVPAIIQIVFRPH